MAGTDSSAPLMTGGPVIVLVEPQLGENIGTAARAMANFGLSYLRLVRPREEWPNEKARRAAAKADHIIDQTQVFNNLEDAISDLKLIYATTARSRELFLPVYGPEKAVRNIYQQHPSGAECGFLFGRERWGLKNKEVVLTNGIVTFPVNPAMASLNIAQSVLLIAYEWMRETRNLDAPLFGAPASDLAHKQDLMGLFKHLEASLDNVQFFYPPEKRSKMILSLRSLFQKGNLSVREIMILHGVIAALEGRKLYRAQKTHGKKDNK